MFGKINKETEELVLSGKEVEATFKMMAKTAETTNDNIQELAETLSPMKKYMVAFAQGMLGAETAMASANEEVTALEKAFNVLGSVMVYLIPAALIKGIGSLVFKFTGLKMLFSGVIKTGGFLKSVFSKGAEASKILAKELGQTRRVLGATATSNSTLVKIMKSLSWNVFSCKNCCWWILLQH